MVLFIYQECFFFNNDFLNGPRRVPSIENLKFELNLMTMSSLNMGALYIYELFTFIFNKTCTIIFYYYFKRKKLAVRTPEKKSLFYEKKIVFNNQIQLAT